MKHLETLIHYWKPVLAAMLTVFALVAWLGIASKNSSLKQQVADQGELLQWLQSTMQELQQLHAVPLSKQQDLNLPEIVAASLKAANLQTQAKVANKSSKQLDIEFELIEIQQFLAWLTALQQDYHVAVQQIKMQNLLPKSEIRTIVTVTTS